VIRRIEKLYKRLSPEKRSKRRQRLDFLCECRSHPQEQSLVSIFVRVLLHVCPARRARQSSDKCAEDFDQGSYFSSPGHENPSSGTNTFHRVDQVRCLASLGSLGLRIHSCDCFQRSPESSKKPAPGSVAKLFCSFGQYPDSVHTFPLETKTRNIDRWGGDIDAVVQNHLDWTSKRWHEGC
jgi:hypothetical protein